MRTSACAGGKAMAPKIAARKMVFVKAVRLMSGSLRFP
jgi:hypothetical protein